MREESGRGQFAPARPQGGVREIKGKRTTAGGFRRRPLTWGLPAGLGEGLHAHTVLPANEFSGYDAGRAETAG
jgi:hypothetical protein